MGTIKESPDASPPNSATIFSDESLQTLALNYMLVGVDPVYGPTAFSLVKFHYRLYGRNRLGTRRKRSLISFSGKGRGEVDGNVWQQWKCELEPGQPRFEVHGNDLRCEKSTGKEIKELPALLSATGTTSHRRWPLEMDGGCLSKELETDP